MSGANNKAIVLRLIEEVLSNGNLAVVDELIDPNFSLHLPGSQEPLHGTEGLKRAAEGLRSGFPDRRMLVEDIILATPASGCRSISDRFTAPTVAHAGHSTSSHGMPAIRAKRMLGDQSGRSHATSSWFQRSTILRARSRRARSSTRSAKRARIRGIRSRTPMAYGKGGPPLSPVGGERGPAGERAHARRGPADRS